MKNNITLTPKEISELVAWYMSNELARDEYPNSTLFHKLQVAHHLNLDEMPVETSYEFHNEKGDILVAIEDMYMTESKKLFLIKDKEYPIINITKDEIIIKSELDPTHYFEKRNLNEYFTIKS